MPVTYQIDGTRNTVRTRCTGHVKLHEVIAHFEELMHDPHCPRQLNVLLDLTELTSAPTSEQLVSVREAITQARSTVQFHTCAIAAPTDLLFGVMRMFEVFTEKEFQLTRTFRQLEDAEKWLNEQSGGS